MKQLDKWMQKTTRLLNKKTESLKLQVYGNCDLVMEEVSSLCCYPVVSSMSCRYLWASAPNSWPDRLWSPSGTNVHMILQNKSGRHVLHTSRCGACFYPKGTVTLMQSMT